MKSRRYSRTPLSIRFDDYVIAEIERHAHRQHKTTSSVIRDAVSLHLARLVREDQRSVRSA